LLKFYTGFGHTTLEVPQTLKVKGSKVKSQRDVMRAKIGQIVNNSAGDYSILIKFSTGYRHMPPDLPQTFKVSGLKVEVTA